MQLCRSTLITLPFHRGQVLELFLVIFSETRCRKHIAHEQDPSLKILLYICTLSYSIQEDPVNSCPSTVLHKESKSSEDQRWNQRGRCGRGSLSKLTEATKTRPIHTPALLSVSSDSKFRTQTQFSFSIPRCYAHLTGWRIPRF